MSNNGVQTDARYARAADAERSAMKMRAKTAVTEERMVAKICP